MRLSSEFFVGARLPPAASTDPPPVAPSAPIVFIADGDTSTREALVAVVRDMGWRARELPSAAALLSEPEGTVPSCLVLDVSLPRYGDLQLQERLAAERAGTPIVCITGAADVLMTVRAMKAGAVDVLPKPVRSDLLVDAVRHALERSDARLREGMALRSLRESYASLSPRERQVMTLVASGLLNKQVSGKLGISEITVKAHRGRVMRKMNARSFADLVKMADKLKIAAPNAAY
ncbi:response regulator transcription factor [Plastoroseomonas hellenica]|uniref:response regulator transcription factor n=1 Tax=Plastoroseomonas hellenica TaxID=2687306 RepID=UPI001BA981E5|nr:LuxR C-terminal-related transcriptional regulator [Plastoroseomonas hellenica]MBR0646922.1 response regulator transcription factor [Plastoroseomonas hellenica]